ncbi:MULTISPECIES: RNA methyltransferase [Protofrankia]|uniref:RNA methyltransferase n=1 Tax=Protofrankia coriariae TaxID=1562887 RepID=A0ABR5F0I2_9ACTN|nr:MULTISPECIES: RNA methyltransferase [Protofrankia]KLL10221.1 RNA methyltransferase [Protofrankia coriariae]ONH34581.1 RNA methyltransferase [Protofrankia sp. BMG5.30]
MASDPPVGPRSARVLAARRLRRPAVRRVRGEFLVEGPQAVAAGLAAGALREIFVGSSAAGRYGELVGTAGIPVRVVSDEAVASLSETVTPQGVVALAEQPRHRIADLDTPRLVAICVDTQDPGNAGTIVRSADAAGADAVIFAGASVDPFGGKAVRASAGSIFHLPVVTDIGVADAIRQIREHGCRIVATTPSAPRDIDTAHDAGELDTPTGWLFGNEARGLPRATVVSADAVLRVPVYGQAESLNLAVATAICLYASARARARLGSGAAGVGGGERL